MNEKTAEFNAENAENETGKITSSAPKSGFAGADQPSLNLMQPAANIENIAAQTETSLPADTVASGAAPLENSVPQATVQQAAVRQDAQFVNAQKNMQQSATPQAEQQVFYAPPVTVAPATGADPQIKRKNKLSAIGFVAALVLAAGIGGGVGASLVTAQGKGAVKAPIEIVNTANSTEITAIAATRTQSVVTLDVRRGNSANSGSGVVYSADGYIITNAHVVAGGGAGEVTVRVRTQSGQLLPAKIVGSDPYADLALLKVEKNDMVPMPIADSSKLQVGEVSVAIGAPLDLPSTVTSGVISAVNRGIAVGNAEQPDSQQSPNLPNWQFELPYLPQLPQPQEPQTPTVNRVTLPVIQTDAAINPGNSGGALLNGAGELIGINVAIASVGDRNSNSGSVGLGFAIPSNLVVRVVEALKNGEKPSHGLLGASVADATAHANATHAGGVLVEVNEGSAAQKAGLKKGDIITAVDGVAAADSTSVSALIRMHEAGTQIELEFYREGKQQKLVVTLGGL